MNPSISPDTPQADRGSSPISYWLAYRLRAAAPGSFTRIVARVAIVSIALGLAVILASIGILTGFRDAIQRKLFSFSGHIQVTTRSLNNSYEQTPISLNRPLYRRAARVPEIAHIQATAQKAGILKAQDEVMGVLLKGIGRDFDYVGFGSNVLSGKMPTLGKAGEGSTEVMISQRIARKLRLQLRDTVYMYFIQEPPRFRRLSIVGIYQTGMDEFDERIIIGDIGLVRELNQWADSLAGAYEIFVHDFARVDTIAAYKITEAMDYDMQAETITRRYMPIFDWLQLLGQNVEIFLSLIMLVAAMGCVSILLIMVMERVPMIGTLKAMGASNAQIRGIFFFQGLRLLAWGLLWGNVAGLGICALQDFTQFIPLDANSYYMSAVPIGWDWWAIAGVNLLFVMVVGVVMFLPTFVVSRITPMQAIRFD